MKNTLIRVLAVIGLASILIVGGLAVTARADVIGPATDSSILTLAGGTTPYTNTTVNLTTQNVANFGTVQLHFGIDVTSTQSVTSTLYWSNDPVATCSSATSFFQGYDYVRELSGDTVTLASEQLTTTAPITVSTTEAHVYAYTTTAVAQQVVQSSDGVTGREYTALGRCLRVQLTWAGGTFTPTIWLRAVDRND